MADTSITGLSMRPAVHGDYADVIKINEDVFGGMDYMPALYHELLRIKGVITCVVEVDGRVVGFTMNIPILSGTAWLGMGGRIRSDYQKQGILQAMGSYIRAQIMQGNPPVRFLYYTRGMTEEQLTKLQSVGSDSIVDIRHWLTSAGDISEIKKALASVRLPQSVKSHMDSTTEVTLFNMHHFKLSSFLPHMFYTGDMFINENTEGSIRTTIAVSTTFATTTERGDLVGVSFVTGYPSKIGIKSIFHFYGTDSAVLKAHMVRQSQAAVAVAGDTRLVFPVVAHRSIPAQEIISILERDLSFKIILKDDYETAIVLKHVLQENPKY